MLKALHIKEASDPNFVLETKKTYFKSEELGTLEGILPGLSDLMGRYMIKEPAFDFARLNSIYAPTYLSSFEYKGENTLFNFLIPAGERPPIDPGVAHSDDLLYFFDTGVVDLQGPDLDVVKHFVKIITDFIFTSKPYYGLNPISKYEENDEFLRIHRFNYIDRNYTKTFYRTFS